MSLETNSIIFQIVLPILFSYIVLCSSNYFEKSKFGGGVIPYMIIPIFVFAYFSKIPWFGVKPIPAIYRVAVLVLCNIYLYYTYFQANPRFYPDYLISESIKISTIISMLYIILGIIGNNGQNYLEFIATGLLINVVVINTSFIALIH